jgi:hypothetical protein
MCEPENPVEFCEQQMIFVSVCLAAIVAIVGVFALIFSGKK